MELPAKASLKAEAAAPASMGKGMRRRGSSTCVCVAELATQRHCGDDELRL